MTSAQASRPDIDKLLLAKLSDALDEDQGAIWELHKRGPNDGTYAGFYATRLWRKAGNPLAEKQLRIA